MVPLQILQFRIDVLEVLRCVQDLGRTLNHLLIINLQELLQFLNLEHKSQLLQGGASLTFSLRGKPPFSYSMILKAT